MYPVSVRPRLAAKCAHRGVPAYPVRRSEMNSSAMPTGEARNFVEIVCVPSVSSSQKRSTARTLAMLIARKVSV